MSESESPKPPTKKPISEKQLAANRANAAKSTGPTSPEGRAHSSRNAVKHGLASENYTVVRLEDIDEIARLRAGLIAAYQPVNSQELYALEQMAIRQQAMLRSARFESGLFSACLSEALGPDGSPRFPLNEDVTYGIEITQAQNRNYCLADGFLRLARQGNGIQLFLRYQAQAERLYRRAVEEFERVKKLRGELPTEPILENDEPFGDTQEPPPNESIPEVSSSDGLPLGHTPNESIPPPVPQPGVADPALVPEPRPSAKAPPQNITNEVWCHSFPRQQLRARCVLGCHPRSRPAGRIHFADEAPSTSWKLGSWRRNPCAWRANRLTGASRASMKM
jgi:hypothetical protein